MKKILLLSLSCITAMSFAQNIESTTNTSQQTKPNIMFVCGGNSGRSVMAEWYTRKNYGSIINDFSRGSGIDPNDQQVPEEFAEEIILANHEATKNELVLQRPTPATVQDINNSAVVLTMTNSHSKRLFNLIDRECLDSNLETRDLSANSLKQWTEMCKDKAQLKAKIHTISECATGKYIEVPDAFGESQNFYKKTNQILADYTDMIMKNYQQTGNFCKKSN